MAGQSELVETGLCKRLEEVTSGCIMVAFLMPRQEHSYARGERS